MKNKDTGNFWVFHSAISTGITHIHTHMHTRTHSHTFPWPRVGFVDGLDALANGFGTFYCFPRYYWLRFSHYLFSSVPTTLQHTISIHSRGSWKNTVTNNSQCMKNNCWYVYKYIYICNFFILQPSFWSISIFASAESCQNWDSLINRFGFLVKQSGALHKKICSTFWKCNTVD